MNDIPLLILTGVLCGILTGFVGGGAGIVIIPILVYLLGFTQHQAQGTALAAFVLPVTISGAVLYWKEGHVNFSAAALLAVGLFAGNFFGAHFAMKISSNLLSKIFGFALFGVAFKMIFFVK